ncbi:MAG: hypothetical protein K8T25_03285 [Planctomycetia bacterium]|nr:hypothetical protein [Planctomycetia bacterium]
MKLQNPVPHNNTTQNIRSRRACLLAALALTLLGGWSPAASGAETEYDLSAGPRKGQLRQVAAVFEVGGQLLMVSEEKELKLPMTVKAKLKFQERLVEVAGEAEAGKAAAASLASARYYDHADVNIQVDGRPLTPTFRADRHLMGVSLRKGDLEFFSPGGPLTREELDIVEMPGDSLIVDSLLPKDPVSIGDTWQPADSVIGAMVGLEAVGQSQVMAKLIEVTHGRARIELNGTVHGAIGGVASQIDLKARCYFDLKSRGVNDLELIYKEKRAVGHAAPGADVTAKLRMQIAPLAASEELTPTAVGKVSHRPTAAERRLEYASSQRKFQIDHDRLWFIAREDASSTIFRRVDRGELVAQCNVTSLSRLDKERRTTLETFQEDIKKTLGDRFERFVEGTEAQEKTGRMVFRVVAEGKVSDLPIQWIYYLVQDAEGRRTSLVFTYEASLVKQFGQADRPFVAALTMFSPPTNADGSPTPAPASKAASPTASATPPAAEHSVKRGIEHDSDSALKGQHLLRR